MDDPSTSAIQPHRPRWRIILLAVILVPVVVLACLWLWLPPKVPAGPIRLVRGEGGSLVPAESPDPPGGLSFEVQAARIKAKNSFNSCSVTSRSDHAGFPCSRLLIVNRSKHVLMARIGPLLPEKLKSLGDVRQIDYYPAGSSPEQGMLAPDITITLDLAKLTESNWPASHSVDATVEVRACNGPPGCRNGYSDHLTPPVVQFDWEGTLHHVSTTAGLVSSAAKYKMVAEDVAKQIAEALRKEFNTRREKEGPLPELPPAFYPPYRPAPELPLAELGQLEVVTSWHGLFNHNETLWRLAIDRPSGEVCAEIQRRLEGAGWKLCDVSKSPDRSYLRMGRDGAMLVAYVPSSQGSPPGSPPKQSALLIHYVDRMTQGELRAAIDQALAQNVSVDVLMRLERYWSEEQSQRILKAIQAGPVRTPQASLTIAKLYRRLGQEDKAIAELPRARALLRTVAQPSDLESKLKNLAKDLGDEKLAEKPIEPRVLEQLGFVELKAGSQIPSREIGLEEPVHFFGKTAQGTLEIISVRAVKIASASGEPSYQLAQVESSEHGRSWGTSGPSHGFSVEGTCSGFFAIDRLGSTERFRLNVHVSGR